MPSQTFSIAGYQLSVAAGGGHGPAVVLLHGILGSEQFWPPLLPAAVREHARWYAVSLPGHYPSRLPPDVSAADLTCERLTEVLGELINRLVGPMPVHLVGWSTGGCLALHLAALGLCNVQSVFTIAGFGRGRWHGALGALQKLAGGGRLARSACRGALAWMAGGDWRYLGACSLAAARPLGLVRNTTARQVLGRVRQDATQHDGENLRLLMASIRSWDVAERFRAIRVPVLLAGGDRDSVIPYRHTCELSEIIPTARLLTWPGLGHTFFGDELPQVQACLQSWLEMQDSSMAA